MSAEVKKSKPKSKEYPAISPQKAIEFVEKFKDYPAGRPISYEVAAKECGVSAGTKSFRYAISAARQFGLLSTSTGLTFTLLESAHRLVHPTESDAALKALKVECFSLPKLYAELIREYSGKSLPAVGTIENLLITYYSILPSAAKGAAQKFIDTATEVGVVQNGVLCLDAGATEESSIQDTVDSDEVTVDENENTAFNPLTPGAQDEFAAPLNIPFGDKRRAVLYMPLDATKEDAEYVRDMVSLMLKRVYKVD